MRQFRDKNQRCVCNPRVSTQIQCVHEWILNPHFVASRWALQHHQRENITKSLCVGEYKNPMMKKCDLTNKYMLESSDLGTVEVIDNTISSLSEKPIENIPCMANTQLLSIKPSHESNLTTVDIPMNTKYLKHNDLMDVASKISE